MNILSAMALTTAVLYGVLTVRRIKGCKMDCLNFWTIMVCLCLGWWSLCDAFFYVAPTVSAAWFWHHLSALGWCGFIPITSYYFLVMAGEDKKMKWGGQVLYWGISGSLTLWSIIAEPTALATEIVQSKVGLGWTFSQPNVTFLQLFYLFILVLYFGFAFWKLYYAKPSEQSVDLRLIAKGFLALDSFAISVGFISMMLIPYLSDYLPPMGFLATLIFILGYQKELMYLDILHVELALNSKNIFEACLDAMLVTDKHFHILYNNDEAKRILGQKELKQTSLLSYMKEESGMTLREKIREGKRKAKLDMELPSGMPVTCSINSIGYHRFQGQIYIISIHDIGQLRQAQKKLDYLAHYDELTGLPNRRRLEELLRESEEEYWAEGKDFELLFLDLNDFKEINDQYGHHAGDEVLKAAAAALAALQSRDVIVTRLAGDEFVLLKRLESDVEDNLVDEIHEALKNANHTVFSFDFCLSAAVGKCRFSEVKDTKQLFKVADKRMYEVKEQYHKRR